MIGKLKTTQLLYFILWFLNLPIEMPRDTKYTYCFVPMCTNTSSKCQISVLQDYSVILNVDKFGLKQEDVMILKNLIGVHTTIVVKIIFMYV